MDKENADKTLHFFMHDWKLERCTTSRMNGLQDKKPYFPERRVSAF